MKAMIVCPSAPINNSVERRKRFDVGCRNLGKLMEVVVAPHALGTAGYVVADTELRLADLLKGYKDKTVDVLVAGTGGWNGGHLLADFPWEAVNKPLAGFSDISVLQNAIYAHTGQVQLLGPMVNWGFCEGDKFTLEGFMKALRGEAQVYKTKEFGEFWQGEKLDGTLVGGNLVSLATLLGTPHAPMWRGKILFWEETEEELYRLDRALTHFKNAGVWDQIGGMVIGRLDQIGETFAGKKLSTEKMLRAHFTGYKFPILKTELSGHNIAKMVTLVIGGEFVADGKTVTIKA